MIVDSIRTANLDIVLSANAGEGLLEIQVGDNGKLTWFVTLEIIKGAIA